MEKTRRIWVRIPMYIDLTEEEYKKEFVPSMVSHLAEIRLEMGYDSDDAELVDKDIIKLMSGEEIDEDVDIPDDIAERILKDGTYDPDGEPYAVYFGTKL